MSEAYHAGPKDANPAAYIEKWSDGGKVATAEGVFVRNRSVYVVVDDIRYLAFLFRDSKHEDMELMNIVRVDKGEVGPLMNAPTNVVLKTMALLVTNGMLSGG